MVSSTGLTPGALVGAAKGFIPTVTDDVGIVRVQVLLNGEINSDYRVPPSWNGVVRIDADLAKLANNSEVDVTFRAFDAAGNSGEATTRVRVDTIRPTATLTPAAQSSMSSGPVTVTLTDVPDDVVSIAVYDEATGVELAKLTSAPWTFTWTATAGTSPTFYVRDRAGNLTGIGAAYIVDDDAPVIRHLTYKAMYNPELIVGPAGATVGGHPGFEAVVDDKSPLSRIEWWADGTLIRTGSLTVGWDATKATDRSVTLELRVWDTVGHASTATFPITIDNTGPTLSAPTPAQGALVRGSTIRTTVKASDPNGIGYLNVAGLRSNPGTTQFVPAGRDGKRTFTWHAFDRLGNLTEVTRTVTVDNTAPTVTLAKAPKNNTKLTKTVRLTATAADRNGIARVQLLVNGKVVATDTRAAYTFTLNPKKYGKKFAVQVRAYDKAGNVKYTAKRTYRR